MPENETVVTDPEVQAGATPPDELGEKGVAALKAERDARKIAEKAANDLAAKVKAFEDRDKSETEKLQEQLQELTSRASKAEREKARLSVIADHQIPRDYQDLVQGDDEDTLTASAAKVAALIAATSSSPSDRATLIIPDEGGHPNLALNGDGIESALKNALGIR
jgi:hypothetical protein